MTTKNVPPACESNGEGEIFPPEALKEIEALYDELIERLLRYHPDADIALVRRAFDCAFEAHRTQRRKSGEPYIKHPLEVAILVTHIKLDEASICAALLHDVVEDTPTTHADLVKAFGQEVADLVDSLTKLDKYHFKSSEERQAANFCKMLIAMNTDLRTILIKLVDRIHNMRTLQHMKSDKQASIAQETLDIYVPIANRLGIEWIKSELEDLSLRYLHPEEFQELCEKIQAITQDKQAYIEKVKGILSEALRAEGITNFTLKGRVKHIYSIYRKLKRSDGVFENLHDLIAFRVIVSTKAECYHALGLVHGMWALVENRFKDYISRPKANQYRSLHTSVIGPDREQFEIQIRTYEMDSVAQEGIAAHWKYKEGNITPAKEAKGFEWLRKLIEYREENAETSDSRLFLNSVKVDLFNDDVFVFTPKGEIKVLPRGSTPIDFAYSVHSDLGDHCFSAKINGAIVPLRYQLKTGDIISIETKSSQYPKSDWLQMVVTNRAKNRINKYLSHEERKTHRAIGMQILEKGLKKLHLPADSVENVSDHDKFFSSLKLQNLDALYVALGSERIKFEQVLERLQPFLPQRHEAAHVTETLDTKVRDEQAIQKLSRRPQASVIVDGIDNLAVHFAKCCSPVPGEPIIGFITRGRGLAIHHLRCQRISNLEPERLVETNWAASLAGNNQAMRSVIIQILAADRLGILQDVIKVMGDMKINITQSHCRTMHDTMQCALSFEVQVANIGQLTLLLRNLQRISGVIEAQRSSA